MFFRKHRPDPLAAIQGELRAVRGALELQKPAASSELAARVAALEEKVKEIDVLATVCDNLVARIARLETFMAHVPTGMVEESKRNAAAAARIDELHPGFVTQL